MRRWVCPACGSGVHAPDRPRRMDVRRYCFPCSEKAGVLVERSAPALDRERTAATEKRVAKTTRARERAVAAERARVTVGGLHLLDEVARVWKLKAIREHRRGQRPVPNVTIRRSRKGRTSGHCAWGWGRSDIVITAGTDRANAAEVVMHELVHAVLGAQGHTARFWSTLRSVAKEAHPDVDFRFHELGVSRGWQVDQWIADRIRESV